MNMTINNNMETKYIIFDGKESGICLFIYSKADYIRNKDNQIMLFQSLALARVYARNVLGIKTPYQYHVYINICGDIIDIERAGKVMSLSEDDKEYYAFYTETDKYFCEETVKEKVISIGYFVFENGDSGERTPKDIGYKKQKQFRKYIKEAGSYISQFPNMEATIETVTKDSNGHLCFNIKNSTAKIHICFNNQIMDLNQVRKEDGFRCIPYDKAMDKFTTIFCYVSQDMAEPNYFKSLEKANTLIQYIREQLENKVGESDPRYVPITFSGLIQL